MPIIYLSPSTQPNIPYSTGGSEREWMNLLTDRMEPYLTAAGIRYVRKSPDMTADDAIRQSNAERYDLHLVLHSNAAPDSLSGTLRGVVVYYYPGSSENYRAATLLADGLRGIYPLPELVRIEPTTTLGEVKRVIAPTIFLEIGYHDNIADALWIQDNLDAIAQNIAASLAGYFGTLAASPISSRPGTVNLSWGHLNIRVLPDMNAAILAAASDGALVTILSRHGNWHLIKFGNVIGYASADYITPA